MIPTLRSLAATLLFLFALSVMAAVFEGAGAVTIVAYLVAGPLGYFIASPIGSATTPVAVDEGEIEVRSRKLASVWVVSRATVCFLPVILLGLITPTFALTASGVSGGVVLGFAARLVLVIRSVEAQQRLDGSIRLLRIQRTRRIAVLQACVAHSSGAPQAKA